MSAALIMTRPAMVLLLLLHAQAGFCAMLCNVLHTRQHFHFILHSFSVTWRFEMFHSYLLYVGAKITKKKKPAYITTKDTARLEDSQMGISAPLTFGTLSRINTILSNQLYILQKHI